MNELNIFSLLTWMMMAMMTSFWEPHSGLKTSQKKFMQVTNFRGSLYFNASFTLVQPCGVKNACAVTCLKSITWSNMLWWIVPLMSRVLYYTYIIYTVHSSVCRFDFSISPQVFESDSGFSVCIWVYCCLFRQKVHNMLRHKVLWQVHEGCFMVTIKAYRELNR